MIRNSTLLGRAIFVLFLFFSVGFSTKTFAQCAGEDNTIDLCDKSSQQEIDLFSRLNGTPQPGGTWTDNDLSGGLDVNTGILDTYVISTGGVFTYTYTNSSCGESATITLNLAGYPGGDNMNAVACDDNPSVNLFQFTGGNPSATVPGNWSLTAVDNDNGDSVASLSGALERSRFNAAQAGTGTYTFTYTITDQVALDCFPPNSDQLSSTVVLEVTPAPESGDPNPAAQTTFCETEDLSGQTNYNLRDAIINEDDGGYWEEITTNEISGVNDSFINIERIRNTLGGGTYIFTYIVEPINQICDESRINVTIVIEDVADFTNASLELTFPTDDEDIICENELPVNPVATITGDPAVIADGDYEVTYSVSPAPNTGTETLTVTITNGEGSFPVNSAFFTAAGMAELRITQILDPNTNGNCEALIAELVDTLTIVALPDASDTQISVNQPLCFGENATLSIADSGTTPAIELINGDYNFTYTLTTGTTSQQYTQTANVTNGAASITLMASALPAAGDYTATLDSVANEAACVTATAISSTFTIDPLPDAQTLSVSVASACESEEVRVTITDTSNPANLADGSYDFTYDLSGAINATGETATNVAITNGTGTFSIPSTLLQNGETTLTLTSVVNTTTTCTATNLTNPTASFTIVATPNLAESLITAEAICEGENASVAISANPALVADGVYNLTYTLTGDNTAAETTIPVTFTNGETSFSLDTATVANPGTTTITITAVTTENQDCPSAGIPASVDLMVNPLPGLVDTVLTTDASCEGDAVSFSLSNPNVVDGTYEIVYQLTGANTLTDQTATLVFASGESDFTIAAADLVNTGNNTLSITQITDLNTANECEAAVTGLSIDFIINPNPDFSNLSINQITGTCQGDDASLVLSDTTGTLADGTYTVTYDLSGANTQTTQTATVTIASGTGTLVIDSALISNAGTTTVNLTSFVNTSTLCESTNTAVSEDFTIVSPPDLTGATLSVDDVCLNDSPVNATLNAPNLSDGSYTFNYNASGASTSSAIAANIPVVGGEAVFAIDAALLANTGAVTLSITSVTNDDSSCFTESLDISTDFVINPLPVIESEDLAVADICLEEGTRVEITGTDLVDGDYEVTYSLSGANTASATETLTFTDGAATIDLAAATLANAGTTSFSITQVINPVTSCVSTTTASVEFVVNPIPDVADGQLEASDICLNENGFVSFTNATGLADGDYTITYDLSGANEATDVIATLSIASGAGSFEIPATSLTETGITTFTLTLVSSSAGCDSDPLVVSDDFEVLTLPDAAGLSVSIADVCFGEPVSVSLSGATLLADADYFVTYVLSGANTSGEITETLSFSAGAATIDLDAALIVNSGSTTLTIVDVQNFTTTCSSVNVGAPAASFVAEDPAAPTLAANAEVFCINDSPTIADLEARVNSSLTVVTYNAATGGAALSANTALADNATYYLGIVNSASGCESSQRLAITVDLSGCDSVFIPNGFSPNGDGINDVFEMKNIDIIYPDYSIEIFNRNGSVVFKGNTATGFWNGQANTNNLGGNTLPNGVYFYIINFNDGQTAPKQGNVYLNR
ncbi:gliding motility-associated C-terminal domain-containing protein [Leeuwenhoekiella parthenopeia]|uniref:Gliding motility-associated C-terminal domain-containing protein n=1 Tax=Leeuwenhoekiella parthenopeia TaxID=2890320 RepID=A0ABS8GU20_9FLAO|nr:gliding motility-associated C-terminal domain-containing protein [Leeuwenhoekiella parthenopeia]MCC4213160.1 gliding motility-associated C-terminal domain-containing protein [Leeuwenhoekiella parthenopeia]